MVPDQALSYFLSATQVAQQKIQNQEYFGKKVSEESERHSLRRLSNSLDDPMKNQIAAIHPFYKTEAEECYPCNPM